AACIDCPRTKGWGPRLRTPAVVAQRKQVRIGTLNVTSAGKPARRAGLQVVSQIVEIGWIDIAITQDRVAHVRGARPVKVSVVRTRIAARVANARHVDKRGVPVVAEHRATGVAGEGAVCNRECAYASVKNRVGPGVT